jgi:hypothetical protein
MKATYRVITKQIEIDSSEDIIRIVPFGDVHKFTESHDRDRWNRFLRGERELNDPNSYYIGMGDYIDFASTKERDILNSPGLHENTKKDLHQLAEERNRSFAKDLSFMGDNLIGIIDGNHNWIFGNGKTGGEDLAERLGTEWLGYLAHVTLKVRIKSRNKMVDIHLVACHGSKGGGKTKGNTINGIDELRAIFPVADLYIMAHDHQLALRPVSCLVPERALNGDTIIKQKNQILGRSGSFKKAFTPDSEGLEIKRLYAPANLGHVEFFIKIMRDRSVTDRAYLEISGRL